MLVKRHNVCIDKTNPNKNTFITDLHIIRHILHVLACLTVDLQWLEQDNPQQTVKLKLAL